MRAAWFVIAALLSGCITETPVDDGGAGSESPEADPQAEPFHADECGYLEALLTISSDDAANMIADGYVPMNGLTGSDESAILFVVYLGCPGATVVLTGITIQPPDGQDGNVDLDAFVLGTYHGGDAVSQWRNYSIGPSSLARFTYELSGTTESMTVETDTESLGLVATTVDAGGSPLSDSDFRMRLHWEDDEGHQAVLLSMDLTRSNSAGRFEGNSVFGHTVPAHVPLVMGGAVESVQWERLS